MFQFGVIGVFSTTRINSLEAFLGFSSKQTLFAHCARLLLLYWGESANRLDGLSLIAEGDDAPLTFLFTWEPSFSHNDSLSVLRSQFKVNKG